jgi:hypothetical protein
MTAGGPRHVTTGQLSSCDAGSGDWDVTTGQLSAYGAPRAESA